jgi:hypothetical protein
LVLLIGILLIGFFISWKGMVPPRFQNQHAGGGFSGIIYTIALIALFCPFYFRFEVWKDNSALFADSGTAILIGIALFILSPSDASIEGGRWGGVLWTLARLGPTMFNRSLLFFPLLIIGCYYIVRIFRGLLACRSEYAFIWLSGFFGWIATTIPNHLAFHRYFEPPVLLFLGSAAGLISRNAKAPTEQLTVLATTLAAAGVVTIYFTDNGFASGPIFSAATLLHTLCGFFL